MRNLVHPSLRMAVATVLSLLFSVAAFGRGLQEPAPAAARISVDGIIQLHKQGVSEGILVTRIKQANQPLRLSDDELIKLNQAKVPDRVIQALMDPAGTSAAPPTVPVAPAAVTAPAVVVGPGGTPIVTPIPTGVRPSGATTDERTAPGDPNDPLAPHDSGIYLYFMNKLKQPEMVLLEPVAYAGAKEGGFLNKNSSSLFSAKTRAVIQGNKASIRAVDHRPIFYFYFEDRAVALGKASIFGGVTSPNQFVLVKLDDKKNTRETVISSESALGGTVGTDQKALVAFKSERLKPGLYKVTFQQDLKPGEYAFMVSAGIGGPQNAGAAAAIQIFDFGVPAEY